MIEWNVSFDFVEDLMKLMQHKQKHWRQIFHQISQEDFPSHNPFQPIPLDQLLVEDYGQKYDRNHPSVSFISFLIR